MRGNVTAAIAAALAVFLVAAAMRGFGAPHRFLDADLDENARDLVTSLPVGVQPGLHRVLGGEADVPQDVPAVAQGPRPEALGQELRLPVHQIRCLQG